MMAEGPGGHRISMTKTLDSNPGSSTVMWPEFKT
jgi:hypothetical protein